MNLVGMINVQKQVETIEEGLDLMPKWEFLDAKLKKEHSKVVDEKKAPENKPMSFESKVVEPEAKLVEPEEAPEVDYDSLTKPQKKDYLEKIARKYGVELDKRKKVEELESIVEELLED